jgi:hypothetical protein
MVSSSRAVVVVVGLLVAASSLAVAASGTYVRLSTLPAVYAHDRALPEQPGVGYDDANTGMHARMVA